MNITEQINSHKYLFLVHIEEPDDNDLRLVMEEGRPSGVKEDFEILGQTFKNTEAVISTDECAAYDVVFEDYIIYSICNEMYARPDDDYEKYTGRLFRVYETSHFLDYLCKEIGAANEKPSEPLKHYGFICENHIVNVASECEPVIKQIRGT